MLDGKIFRAVEEEAEVEQAPLGAGLPVRRIEHALGEDEVVRIGFLPIAPVTGRPEHLDTAQLLIVEGITQIELAGKIQLPVPESARSALARDHTEIGALVIAVEGKPMVLEPLTAVRPETVAVSTEHVRSIPPIFQGPAHALIEGTPLAADCASRAGEDVARNDVLRIADENRIGPFLLVDRGCRLGWRGWRVGREQQGDEEKKRHGRWRSGSLSLPSVRGSVTESQAGQWR
jgi:hypothetical protein